MPPSPIPDLNPTQLHVLQILWDAGQPLKPVEIQAKFPWPIENATLRSVLKVLVERGEVAREREGKAYLYRPAQKKGNALSQWLDGLATVFSGGSRAGLIAQLIQDESLTPEEIGELEKIARQKKSC